MLVGRVHTVQTFTLRSETPSSRSCLIGEGSLECRLVLVQVLELQQADLAQGLDSVMSRLGRHHELHIHSTAASVFSLWHHNCLCHQDSPTAIGTAIKAAGNNKRTCISAISSLLKSFMAPDSQVALT